MQQVEWDQEDPRGLWVLVSGGPGVPAQVQKLRFRWGAAVCSGRLGTAVVSDARQLLLTPTAGPLVPPPMSYASLGLPAPVQSIALAPADEQKAPLLATGKDAGAILPGAGTLAAVLAAGDGASAVLCSGGMLAVLAPRLRPPRSADAKAGRAFGPPVGCHTESAAVRLGDGKTINATGYGFGSAGSEVSVDLVTAHDLCWIGSAARSKASFDLCLAALCRAQASGTGGVCAEQQAVVELAVRVDLGPASGSGGGGTISLLHAAATSCESLAGQTGEEIIRLSAPSVTPSAEQARRLLLQSSGG